MADPCCAAAHEEKLPGTPDLPSAATAVDAMKAACSFEPPMASHSGSSLGPSLRASAAVQNGGAAAAGRYRARAATVITSGSIISTASSTNSRRSTPHSRSGSSPASRSSSISSSRTGSSTGVASSCSTRPAPRRITADLLTQPSVCNGKKKKGKDESLPHFLSGLTHLNLHGRGLTCIEHLEHCARLQVLYLYDNYLERVEGLHACRLLTHLHLQDNDIRSLEDSTLPLARLQKLYLCGNRLERLSLGLSLPGSPPLCLQELHVSHQHRTSEGQQPLTFDPDSLLALADCLVVLNVSGNGLVELSDLRVLGRLERLNVAKNQVADVEEVEALVAALPRLRELDCRENPVTRTCHRYRETTVLASHPALGVLDGKPVRPELREMLHRLEAHRERVKRRGGREAAQLEREEGEGDGRTIESEGESQDAGSLDGEGVGAVACFRRKPRLSR